MSGRSAFCFFAAHLTFRSVDLKIRAAKQATVEKDFPRCTQSTASDCDLLNLNLSPLLLVYKHREIVIRHHADWRYIVSLSEDGRLISQIRQGNILALKALYEKYNVQVYRTALAITHDREAAEDILQDCFLKVYIHVDKLDGSLPLSPWLHRVTVNLSYNWANKRRRWLQPLEEVVDHLVAAPRTLPESALERGELQLVVQKAIASLGFKHRVVVVLFYLNGFSLKEIAYILDCPVGTVKSRLHYARRKLRRKLERDRRLSPGVVYEFS